MNFKLSFRITILVLFAALMLILSSVVIYVNFTKNRETVLVAADNLLEEMARNTFGRVQLLFEPLFAIAETVVLLPNIATEPSLAPHPIAPFLFGALDRHPEMVSAYAGFETGDFFQLYSFAGDNELSRAGLKAPANAAYALRAIFRDGNGARIQTWRFLDKNRSTVGSRADPTTEYDPRQRAWYRTAIATDATIVTDFYAFFATPSIGVTVAKRFDGSKVGVFGIDLTLSSMSGYLKTQRDIAFKETSRGQIALIAADGRLIAHSDKAAFDGFLARQKSPAVPTVADVGDPALGIIHAQYGAKSEPKMEIEAPSGKWLARISALPKSFTAGTIVAIAMPHDEFMGPLEEATEQALVISAVIVVLFLPVVYLAANAVSAPLARLTGEIENIRHLELAVMRPIDSMIREIQNLADALRQSKFMLNVFGKYVPRNLVQQFVDSGTEPVLGGERRPVTVFFSDVKDFTTMSEELPPERLMLLTSEYLEGLVDIILDNRGTVDKFVGDQIMAYWNAPIANPDHHKDGCLAVLRCRDWSNARNAAWEKEGHPIFYTRFALHAGDAVVGNIGSSDRMDYTVVGNTINLGSRLEGLNKIYGTQVLVSETVAAEVVGRFVVRPVDMVLPKGAVFPLALYELLGAHPDWADAPADLVTDRRTVALCDSWAAVYALYLKRDWGALAEALDRHSAEFGEDGLASVYYERVTNFTIEPPPEDWDGIIRYSEK